LRISEGFLRRKVGACGRGGLADPHKRGALLFQKLVRTVFKSPTSTPNSRWNSQSASAFIRAASMNEGGVSVFDCMESDTVLIIGSHISDENLATEYIVRRVSGNRRMNLIASRGR
jgi:predicted molibdopterin-dependent oxidoreductase YjgC